MRLYLLLIIEIYEYFKNTNGCKIIVYIPHLFTAECVENWIKLWKKDDFYIKEDKERPNRDLLVKISNLKDQMKRNINILFNYKL